jgi:UDP-glucose 4-epimerase
MARRRRAADPGGGRLKLVTGGAGFIGSHLVDALVARGDEVVILDNLSTGSASFISHHRGNRRVRFVRGDCMKAADMAKALRGVDEVWHMAADPDVREGAKRPWSNFRDGAVLTFRVLDAMRRADVKRFVYASSSTVYGEATKIPTPEEYGPLMPISPYGASKLSGESIISAFVGTFGFQGWIYRFGNVVGPRSTHGVTFDFFHRLRKDPRRLTILGDGRQSKSYLSSSDCVAGMMLGVDRSKHPLNIFNLATDGATNVRAIADIVCKTMGLTGVQYEFTGGDRGWKGDVPVMRLAIDRIQALGWVPKHTSDEALRLCARAILDEERRGRGKGR